MGSQTDMTEWLPPPSPSGASSVRESHLSSLPELFEDGV